MSFFNRTKVDKSTINTKYHSCPTSLILQRHGSPRSRLSDKCEPATNSYWRSKFVTKDIGPFRATGFEPFLDVLTEAFKEVKSTHPELYSLLRSAGCLCIRRVRGTNNSLSNHGLGMAIDIELHNPATGKNVLDDYGDGFALDGLFILYSIMKKYRLYWGAGFPKEDAMHFEASKELVLEWIEKGKL